MSSAIPRLTLYPLYSGGSPVTAPRTEYDPTDFALYGPRGQRSTATSAYQSNAGYGIAVRPDQRLESQLIGANNYFDRVLDLNYQPVARNAETPYLQVGSAPETPPNIPSRYTEALSRFGTTEANAANLLAQDSFRLSNAGSLGFTVITDGAGGVAEIKTTPTVQRLGLGEGQVASRYPLPDRASITEGAIFKVDRAVPGQNSFDPNRFNPALGGLRLPGGLQQGPDALSNALPLASRINRPEGLSSLDGLANRPFRFGENPIQDRLYQLRQPDTGLAVTGAQAEGGVATARQIAAVRSDFDVTLNQNTQKSLQRLQELRIQTESTTVSPLRMAQQMDGRVPVFPQLAALAEQRAFQPTNSGGEPSLSANVEDSSAKRGSSGGAFSFRGTAGGEGGGFSSGQQEQRRKPFSRFA